MKNKLEKWGWGNCQRTASNFLYRNDIDELQSGSYLLRGWNRRLAKYRLKEATRKL